VRRGFLVEYDRGTERASQYAAKFAAYYAYRNSGQAARDYAGFPAVLFVTTRAAEERIAAAAERAWGRYGGSPLPVFVTTLDRIATNSYGMFGPIWRRPGVGGDCVSLYHYWLQKAGTACTRGRAFGLAPCRMIVRPRRW
jgi:Replication-relaxation